MASTRMTPARARSIVAEAALALWSLDGNKNRALHRARTQCFATEEELKLAIDLCYLAASELQETLNLCPPDTTRITPSEPAAPTSC